MDATAVDYKQVNYKRFVSELNKFYEAYKKRTGLGEVDLAVAIGKSSMTVRNCFSPLKQAVTDGVLTTLTKCMGMTAKIEWVDGARFYYIENN